MARARTIMTQEQFDAWVAENPLRKWRTENRSSMQLAAANIGVSISMIQWWERGVHTPQGENMATIVEMVGPGTQEAWINWLNSKP